MTRTTTVALLLAFPTAIESFGQHALLTRKTKYDSGVCSFVASSKCPAPRTAHVRTRALNLSSSPEDGGDKKGEGDAEGVELAADFAKVLQQRNIEMGKLDFYDVEEEEEGDDEDEDEKGGDAAEKDKPAAAAATEKKDKLDDEDEEEDSAITAQSSDPMSEYDASEFDEEVASSVLLTDEQASQELKERVLETAGGFVEYLKGVDEDDDDNDEEKKSVEEKKEYAPPQVVPDPDLTAGEVVTLVLEALAHNDVPTPNRGVEILFDYYSPRSSVKTDPDLTAEEYAEFLRETEYHLLFEASEVRIERGDYSSDSRRAFFTARCNFLEGPTKDYLYVNFILSAERVGQDDCWMIDSILIRPEGLRRRSRG